MNTFQTRDTVSCGYVTIMIAALIGLSPAALRAQVKPAIKTPLQSHEASDGS
jgi:hypothetical protein